MNNVATGPTQVIREDRPGSYTETLTMTATPHVTGGVPDGTEAISGVQTLSRSYTNAAGQVVRTDAYFNLSGVTYSTAANIGTKNSNYWEGLTDYDNRGWQTRTQTPTGTITRTVHDGLGRTVSTWVGTNDTPASGQWSPTNNTSPSNMIKTADLVYDNNTLAGSTQVGDGNLTQVIAHPGGTAPDRVSESYYDWRDRLVATKASAQSTESTSVHRPIVYRTYDNLDEVTQVQSYDGDGVSITFTGGVPNAPAAANLRAQTVTSYDDQGRVYKTQQYSVDPSNGTVSTNALTTQLWYNHRGLVIKTSSPGEPGASATGGLSATGVVQKSAYDGAGRETVSYITDGGGDTSWTDAGNVTGDNVLSQVETTYDKDGDVIFVVDRERNHDETTTGALGNPTTAPKARVSYSVTYYDLALRTTATVDVGTNGGTAYTRPTTAPANSDTVLTTVYGFAPAGWVNSVTDSRGIVEQKSYDNLGELTQTIEDFTNGTPTTTTNKTTNYHLRRRRA